MFDGGRNGEEEAHQVLSIKPVVAQQYGKNMKPLQFCESCPCVYQGAWVGLGLTTQVGWHTARLTKRFFSSKC